MDSRPIGFYPIDTLTYDLIVTLVAGETYEFVMDDEGNDGLCCNQVGTFFLVEIETGKILSTGTGNFGSRISEVFILE